MKKTTYTLVQHSAYVAGGDPQFQHAVESSIVSLEKQADAVRKAGGVLFDTYKAVDEAEERENYPPEVKGLTPRVRGKFSRAAVKGQRIYIPAPPVVVS